MPSPFEPPRTRDLRRIHTGRRALALDDETYRALLERITGQRSAADLDPKQRRAVIDELYRLGFRPKNHRAPGKIAPGKTQLMAKIQALLFDGAYSWAYADGVARKVCKIDSVRFCNEEQLRKIVAALTYDQQRRRARAQPPTPPEAA